jgi:hypothetical protein
MVRHKFKKKELDISDGINQVYSDPSSKTVEIVEPEVFTAQKVVRLDIWNKIKVTTINDVCAEVVSQVPEGYQSISDADYEMHRCVGCEFGFKTINNLRVLWMAQGDIRDFSHTVVARCVVNKKVGAHGN